MSRGGVVGQDKCSGWYDYKKPPSRTIKTANASGTGKRKIEHIVPSEKQVKKLRKAKFLGNYLDGLQISQEERDARGFGNPAPKPTYIPPTQF